MKLGKEQKNELVRGLKTRITESPTVYLADFTGLSVKHMTDLRRRFRSAGVDFLVAKNTLALRALHEASIDTLDDVLAGPLSGYTDAVLDDEFPLSMFYEALEKKMRPVIASTAGIRAGDA